MRHNAVEIRLRVAEAVLARRELAKVTSSDGADGVEESENDAACWETMNLDVKLKERG